MKKGRKVFRLITTTLALLLSSCFALGALGCKDKEIETPDNGLYNEMAGVNLSETITPLVDKGKTGYKIVIPAQANETEVYAAEEMQKYVKQSTGVELAIVRDNAGVTLGQKLLSIGKTKFVSETGLDTSNLNVDGFRIKTKDETVMINGERDRGTLYGVYSFLEKFIGYRFLSVDYEYVPELKSIPLYEMDIVEIPDIRSRTHNSGGAEYYTPEILVKRKMVSGQWNSLSTKYGGGYEEEWATTMHAYNQIVPIEKFGEAHPEWYTAGKTTRKQWELSNGLTDEGTIDETMETSLIKQVVINLKEILLKRPDATYVGIGHNDNQDYCTGTNCNGRCLEQRELFGGHSGHAIVFINAVIREINAWLEEIGDTRDVKFVMYAYQYTVEPPNPSAPRVDLAVPHEDLYMMCCPYTGNYYFNAPFADAEKNYKFNSQMESWKKITNRVCIFEYTTNFQCYLTWFPNVGVLQPNMKWYKELGALRVVCDGGSISYEWLLVDYLLSRIMWNVNRDVNALISEFNRLFFGEKAGKIMDAFVHYNQTHFELKANEGGKWQGATCTGSDWLRSTNTLNVDYIRQIERYVQDAKQAIENDDTLTSEEKNTYLSNMIYPEIQVYHSKFINYDKQYSTTPEADKAFYQEYYDVIKKAGVTKFGLGAERSFSKAFAELGIN